MANKKRSFDCAYTIVAVVMSIALNVVFFHKVIDKESKIAENPEDYDTGVIRVKKDSTIYLSPIDGTLVFRKIDFRQLSPEKKQLYGYMDVGDTLTYYNPKHNIELSDNGIFVLRKLVLKDPQIPRDLQILAIQREAGQR
ncbi:MAG: hypothetical protein J6W40_03780 [Alphaproteobacteria bacterium]|nr:hypothetical protein [Alphaproteobacteria bacterium]